MEKTDMSRTPSGLGYRMPAEWEKHDAMWLAWPYGPETFIDNLSEVEETYVKIIGAMHESEQVNLAVKDKEIKNRVISLLKNNGINQKKVSFHLFDYADVWFRDYGPIFLTKGKQLAMSGWIFNAWGEKYETLMKDTRIPSFINKELKIPYFKIPIVLEGGSIDVNGKGTLLTTKQCLLNRNRNPKLGRKDIENELKENLGVK